ncbi:UDP-N-acetylmuramate--L-alanine ligase [Clostridium frigidicarnis]|uniref:UDP-N-acetylmuramate--L-alanine ligase n=1 Tax=Clostridium frigidicarnis TaxID=84698 RepID=A0A1I0YMA0_9CLOT|nr:UDP-N-acetylmuramate--L-alanine ligase [Clostridium frigidicarnis]SFB14535.1 UDP-N-acetylmuramate--L-alanine ligase [Clostridium frigidicarnis]
MSFDFLKDKNKKVHFIGIGGISMSGLAAILLNNGYKVSGSDMKSSTITDRLKSKKAEIYIGHKASNINDVDLVVYTAAVPSDNEELLYAKENNILLMDRAEFLGLIMKGHKFNVAVAGTHGKTTTTSMLSHVTLKSNLDPTILVGADLDIIEGNFRIGASEYFITEACEYKESFLKFYPYIGILLNIDADHLDYYRDINHIEETFLKFVNLIPEDGYAIGCADDSRVLNVLKDSKCNTLTYGIDNGDLIAKNIKFTGHGSSFDVILNNEFLFKIDLMVPGKHNILNALGTIASSLILKVSYNDIIDGLKEFTGAHKRFEFKGEKNGVTVIDDYAHHPVEIKATLSSTKNMNYNNVYCVFQPHTYTRTYTLFNDFVESFYDCDELILMDIYAAREKDTGLVSSNELGEKLREKGIKCVNVHSHEEALNYIKPRLSEGDLLMTVGAGDVVKVGEMFLNN